MPKLRLKRLKRFSGEHGEVMRPHLAVVEPGLVFDLAGEEALDAADGVGGPLAARLRQSGRAGQGGGSQEKVAALHNRIVLLIGKKSRHSEAQRSSMRSHPS